MKTPMAREVFIAFLATLVGAVAEPALAATLLTSATGYSGPELNLRAFNGGAFVFTAGPVSLPGGITFSSASANAVLGDGVYFLGANGESQNSYVVGTNDPAAAVTLDFATPVTSFGANFNYSPGTGADPVISAYAVNGALIAAYDLADLAPIATPGQFNAFAFRGIDGDGASIAAVTFSGDYIIAEGVATAPEPATWTLLFLGFAGLGLGLRTRRRRLETAVTAAS